MLIGKIVVMMAMLAKLMLMIIMTVMIMTKIKSCFKSKFG